MAGPKSFEMIREIKLRGMYLTRESEAGRGILQTQEN